MKFFLSSVLLWFFSGLSLPAQVSLHTVVPAQIVKKGESFRVQYILRGKRVPVIFHPPAFNKLRVVSGPALYYDKPDSSGESLVCNYVYTLEALQEGTLLIPPAAVTMGGKIFRSGAAVLTVVSPQSVAALEQPVPDWQTALLAGKDPEAVIRENLFLKLTVDRQVCYPGQPVTASFRLFSRLNVRSNITRNPGFYGFTVFDVLNLNDRLQTTERINGKWFEVYTIRQVQLFPLLPGKFIIDEMELSNRISLSAPAANQGSGSVIREGVASGEKDNTTAPGEKWYEKMLRTRPLQVEVRPLPVAGAPAGFSGAVGHFQVEAKLNKEIFWRKEEVVLDVYIKGTGNLLQLVPPRVDWPAGTEVFSPEVTDRFQRGAAPLSGERIFRFRFIPPDTGSWQVPPIRLDYFHADSGKYAAALSTPLRYVVRNGEKPASPAVSEEAARHYDPKTISRVAALLVILLSGSLVLFTWLRRKKDREQPESAAPGLPSVEEEFAPAATLFAEGASGFFAALYQCNWNFYRRRLQLAGESMDKRQLLSAVHAKGLDEEWQGRMEQLLEKCEWQLYTSVPVQQERESLLNESRELARLFEA